MKKILSLALVLVMALSLMACGNSAADNGFIEYIRCTVILRGSKANLYMSVLTVSTGLFLVFCIHICFFTECFTEWNFRFGKNDVHFVAFF